MNQISFSVIVPVYNKEKQIKRSIKSILEQTYKNFELIIVCDPSTDNSNIEIEKFKDDRIRIFYRNEAGSGGYAARNLGINESKSEWIAFLDADDEWYPTHLEEAKNIILNNKNISFVFFNFNMVINNKIKIEHKIKHNKVLKRFDLLKLYSKQQLMNTNSIVVDRKLIMQAGMFPEGKAKRGGDSDLWLRLMLNCSYAIWSYKSTSCYHFDDSGVIKNHKTLGEKHIIYNTVNEYLKKFDNLSNQEKNIFIKFLIESVLK